MGRALIFLQINQHPMDDMVNIAQIRNKTVGTNELKTGNGRTLERNLVAEMTGTLYRKDTIYLQAS